jgi:hypothetical protein
MFLLISKLEFRDKLFAIYKYYECFYIDKKVEPVFK